MDLTHERFLMILFMDVALTGFSPFEFELADKGKGDEMVILVHTEEMVSFFCHHFIPQLAIPDGVGNSI